MAAIKIPMVIAALFLALGVAQAQAPQASPPPPANGRWRDSPPPRDDLPPLSRGSAPPLYIANSGLNSGVALVHAGLRVFGLCWNAGSGPYSVELRDPSGTAILTERNIAGTLFSKPSQPVALAPGRYTVHVADQNGQGAEGHFQVVASPPSLIAASDHSSGGAAIDEVLRLADLGTAYRYDAFLSLQDGRPQPASAEDDLQKRLCHR